MTPVLHEYPTSPFSELARLAFGLKAMAWQSVTIPVTLPKPDLVELTGGYARTPVLQVGADLFCDTAAILTAIDRLQPAPSLYPPPLGALHKVMANWAGGPQFMAHVGAALGAMPEGALPPAFIADRKGRFGLDMAALARATPHLTTQALTAAHWLDQSLADGRAFVGGDAPGHADLAFYSNIWFVRGNPFAKTTTEAILSLPRLAAWYDRVAALGHGKVAAISADDAIAIAAAASPAPVTGRIDAPFSAGQMVSVKTDGSGDAPVTGRLAQCDATGIVVLREGERCGPVAVHFPQLGQMVMAV
ncbi:glutathione S-transferase family protein [Polymorphobacter fuscus]|uniref:Glutathione S-transferase family protein n=1 Tax=Sandarakinorhabdus fusca TaxID=1439888 RepID=A0A7C9KW29_9SPHN|nr:glutathione S-transferase family protein [Polymorphobacter fuscus]KAB7647416.1 glutathione S-transferase family protein [Polymorphobacter fuscus]MQT16665.1 glutathione S-transferase family protein [Polymorphobacter fuscus]NJC09350.1 glutathione S-transferase [Polymorphobacter fuscus]